MIDFTQLATVDIKELSEEEADLWCERILKFTSDSTESRDQLLTLFTFTRSLLKVKSIQTEVLIEELQNVGTRLDAVTEELDHFKTRSPPAAVEAPPTKNDDPQLLRLQDELEAKEDEIEVLKQQNRRLEETIKGKDRELGSLRLELESVQQELRHRSGVAVTSEQSGTSTSTASETDLKEHQLKLNEKNSQIEQLLDRLYDSDRISLDLAEELAKLRLDAAKVTNEHRIAIAKVEMLSVQVEEFSRLNESLVLERDRKEKEVQSLRGQLEQRSAVTLLGGASSRMDSPGGTVNPVDVSTNFYNELSGEIKRLNELLSVKETEIDELRSALSEVSAKDRSLLEQRREQIERLEEELAIVGSKVASTKGTGRASHEDEDDPESSLLVRQLRRRIRKLRKEKLNLLERLAELEAEAGIKDEDLERQRRRTVALLAGDASSGGNLKQLLEENAVLSRMIQFRDEKINFLIDQLNRHHLVGFKDHGGQPEEDGGGQTKAELPLMDQVIALGVERDVLKRQLDALQSHMETIQKENLELQLGMKEILDGLRASDTSSDLVIECPSLERLCLLLENRLIYPALLESETVDLAKVILLKSELDYVRGQNEQLRSELKQLRGDFLSVIDEYTNDILENWTLPMASGDGGEILEPTSEITTTLEDSSEDSTPTSQKLNSGSSEETVKSDLLQAYYQQLKKFQHKTLTSTTVRRKTGLKKGSAKGGGQRSRRVPPPSIASPKESPLEHSDSSTQTDVEVEATPVSHTPKPKIRFSIFAEKSAQTEFEEIVPSPPQNNPEPVTASSLKSILFEDAQLRDALLADPEIQTFIIENGGPLVEQVIIAHPSLWLQLLKNDEELLQRLLENSRIKEILKAEQEVRQQQAEVIKVKSGGNPDNDDEEYVEMFDIGLQVKPKQNSQYCQASLEPKKEDTAPPPPPVPETAKQLPCPTCAKYLQMFNSIRGLIEKERHQVRLQETKLLEQIEGLKSNLKLVQTEYHLDLEARTEEIRDLRQKLQKSSKVVEKHVVDVGTRMTTTSTAKMDIQSLLESYPSFAELVVLDSNGSSKQIPAGQVEGKTTKSILETIIVCLQNCLKQKDEALAQYRQLMEETRRDLISKSAAAATDSTDLQEASPRPPSSSSDLETLYQELFLKPCSEQNAELLALLQKTFAELNSLRANSQMQIETLKAELEVRLKASTETAHRLEQLTKERAFFEAQVKLLQDKEHNYLEQIASLNGKVAELAKRTISTTTLKKKVENTVFQESADLRTKITQLTEQTKKLEVDRWTAEKKWTAERGQLQQKLQDRQTLIESLNTQIEKYQSVLAKLEKKLQQVQRSQVTREVITRPEMATKTTQTTAKVTKPGEPLHVRFKDETSTKVEQRTVIVQRHQIDSEPTGGGESTSTSPAGTTMSTTLETSTASNLIEELQSLLVQSLKREKMTAMVREVSAVGEEVLGTTVTTTSEKEQRGDAPGHPGASPYLSAREVYEQLIDMQFERLVSENAQLKVQLKMTQLVGAAATGP